jgi:hypothetical protein
VQLHLHPEWLELAGDANPLAGRTGRNMHDFTESEQVELIVIAREFLVRAGAPVPTAFRAGHFGDETGAAAMPHSPFRAAARVMEQLASNALYGAS